MITTFHVFKLITAFSFCGLALFGGQQTPVQSTYMQRTFGDVERAARAASSKDAMSTKALVEAVLQATWFAALPEAIHERLLRASLDFDSGFGHVVTESQVTKATNRLASELRYCPGWFAATGEQVRIFGCAIYPARTHDPYLAQYANRPSSNSRDDTSRRNLFSADVVSAESHQPGLPIDRRRMGETNAAPV